MAGLDYNRTKQCFQVIKLPETLASETYGLKGCCDEYLVLAGGSEDWQNDITSAFLKLQLVSDSCTFVLQDSEGNNTSYQPVLKQFPNDSLAYYATIEWNQVLGLEGSGCYTIQVNYSIAGVIGSFDWGTYELKQYSPENAEMTIRLKAVFNQVNLIEEINFSGSNMADTIRFYGYFGKRQPNIQIDNLIYQNRQIDNVQRENLNSYELDSDPLTINYTRKLIDLYFLSESELYISEHHPLNHTSEYKNLPVSISETAEVEYLELSKYAKIKMKFNDKTRDQLTRFM
ncbi:hypothetical protein UFOVP597_47 [uncultured Caudovirales phage]|uniref:Uncharacterized protein n=1 Tax=uncultured Caudovirales phage TaxID=2100421 RepID=A0A6J5N095_9CAUD|nr:hypothetical protein UFOVP597_47 [uncultured Caudovirales phage]